MTQNLDLPSRPPTLCTQCRVWADHAMSNVHWECVSSRGLFLHFESLPVSKQTPYGRRTDESRSGRWTVSCAQGRRSDTPSIISEGLHSCSLDPKCTTDRVPSVRCIKTYYTLSTSLILHLIPRLGPDEVRDEQRVRGDRSRLTDCRFGRPTSTTSEV